MKIGIIGGGVYGCAIAHFLERFGDEDVFLFERGSIGEGSTSKSGAIIRHHYSNERQVRLAIRGREIIENFRSHTGHEAGFVRNKWMLVVDEQDESALRDNVRMHQEVGLDVDLIAPEEAREHLPPLNTDGLTIGAIEHEAGYADPLMVTNGFLERAKDHGTTVYTNTAVTDIEMDGERATAIRTDEDTHEVDYVVNAAGPWGAEIGAMVGLELPLEWYRSQLAELSTETPYDNSLPTISDSSTGLYAKPETGGHFIADGAAKNRPVNDATPGIHGIDESYVQTISNMVSHRLPGLGDPRVTATRSGIITVSPDWHQIVGVPTGYENFFNAVGPSGHGFKEAPGFAESIAQTILGQEPKYDLTPYRLERFADDDAFEGRYDSGSRA